MSNEIWKDIIGYEGLYKISNSGKILSLPKTVKAPNGTRTTKPRIMSVRAFCGAYPSLTLCKPGKQTSFTMHRLMAIHFIPNPEKLPHVNHKDGNKQNYSIENLEWATASQNELHSIHILNKKPSFKNFVSDNDRVVRHNGKNIYGIKLQSIYDRLMNGEFISVKHLDKIEGDRLRSQIAELRKRYEMKIVTRKLDGNWVEYYYDESAVLDFNEKGFKRYKYKRKQSIN